MANIDGSGAYSAILSSRKLEGKGNMQSIQVKSAKTCRLTLTGKCFKKRHRGKRKSRKESRRRVRPGKSRSKVMAMGAPFNNNNFLISQRNLEGEEIEGRNSDVFTSGSSASLVNLSLPRSDLTCPYQKVGSWSSAADHLPATTELTSPFCVPEQSDRSAETSDYSSLNSPVYTSSCVNTGEDDTNSINYNSDEIFDEEFELRNFEADYLAQQQELRDEMLKIPRRELEDRYFLLLEQTRMFEEKKEDNRKMAELELQVRDLLEENRQLRLDVLHSGSLVSPSE